METRGLTPLKNVAGVRNSSRRPTRCKKVEIIDKQGVAMSTVFITLLTILNISLQINDK